MSNIEQLYIEMKSIRNSGIDCSEIAENFIRSFGGKALLILSKDYKQNKFFKIHNAYGDSYDFLYHYAYIANDGTIWDPMLDFEGVNRMTYDSIINVVGNVTIKEVTGPYLKSYC